MISNKRQYDVAKAKLKRYRELLDAAGQAKQKMPPDAYSVMVQGLMLDVEEVEAQLRAYEQLSNVCSLRLSRLEDLGEILIKARIAREYTQEGLAEKLGLKAQQIQRYEAAKYLSASLRRVLAVAEGLGIRVESDVWLSTDQLHKTNACGNDGRKDCVASKRSVAFVTNRAVLKSLAGVDLSRMEEEMPNAKILRSEAA